MYLIVRQTSRIVKAIVHQIPNVFQWRNGFMTFLGMLSTILIKTRSKLNMACSCSLVNVWKRTRPVPRVCAYCMYTVAYSMKSLKRERLVTVVWNISGPVNDSEIVAWNNFIQRTFLRQRRAILLALSQKYWDSGVQYSWSSQQSWYSGVLYSWPFQKYWDSGVQ
jgi:hypothetical protein